MISAQPGSCFWHPLLHLHNLNIEHWRCFNSQVSVIVLADQPDVSVITTVNILQCCEMIGNSDHDIKPCSEDMYCIAVQCCEGLKCINRVDNWINSIGCWIVQRPSDWLTREASPHRQRCRDDCVNVKLFVKLFVISSHQARRAGMSWSSPQSSWIRSDRIPGTITLRVSWMKRSHYCPGPSLSVSRVSCLSCLAHAAPGKDVVFIRRLLCFLPIVSLFWRNSILCFTMTSPQLWTMRRLCQWEGFTESSEPISRLYLRSTLSYVQSPSCARARFSRKEPNKHIKSASFLIKPDFIIIIAIVFHKLGQKVTPGPYLYILVHDTTQPGTQFARKSAQLLRKMK